MRAKNYLIVAAMAIGLFTATRADAAPFLSENFEYGDSSTGNTTYGANWTRGSTTNAVLAGGTGTNAVGGFNPIPDTAAGGEDPATVAWNGGSSALNTSVSVSQLARFNNASYAARSFDGAATITADKAWSVKFDMALETFARNGGVGILAANGSGYTMNWNATNVNQNTARGVVAIAERSVLALGNQSYGTAFANGRRPTYTNTGYGLTQPSGTPTYANGGFGSSNGLHPIIGYRVTATPPDAVANNATYEATFSGLAQFELRYTPNQSRSYLATDGITTVNEFGALLEIFVTGPSNPHPEIAIFSAIDTTPFTDSFEFSQVYITGANTVFDNVLVDYVPEPASIGLISGLGLVLLQRRRRGGTH